MDFRDPRIEAILEEVESVFHTGHSADVIIHCGGHRMATHRLVLAAHSNLFKTIFEVRRHRRLLASNPDASPRPFFE